MSTRQSLIQNGSGNMTSYSSTNPLLSKSNTSSKTSIRYREDNNGINRSSTHIRDGILLPRTSESHPLRMSWLFSQMVLEGTTPPSTESAGRSILETGNNNQDSTSHIEGHLFRDNTISQRLAKWIDSELKTTLAQQLPKGPSKERSSIIGNASPDECSEEMKSPHGSSTFGQTDKLDKRRLSIALSSETLASTGQLHTAKAAKDRIDGEETQREEAFILDTAGEELETYDPKDREMEEQAEAGIVPWSDILVESTQQDGPDHPNQVTKNSTVDNDEAGKEEAITWGNFALSSCPGKKVRLHTGPVNGKAMIARDLSVDIGRMASVGIGGIICCLNDMELKYLGAPWQEYATIAQKQGISVLRIPIIEGAAPSSIAEVNEILEKADELITKGQSILCHCRGGVGRAGVIACCYLIRKRLVSSPQDAIRFVRLRRSPKAIETRHQEDFIYKYFKVWNE